MARLKKESKLPRQGMRGLCAIIDTVKHSIKVEGTQLLHTGSMGHMRAAAT